MEDRKKLSLSPNDFDWNQLLLSHISVGFLMHLYGSWQLPATFGSCSIKASAAVSGVKWNHAYHTCSCWHVVCPQITSSCCLDQDSFHTTVAHCNKYIYKRCLFLLHISECNQRFMYLSSEHTGTAWAKVISTLNSMSKIRVTKHYKYNMYPLQGEGKTKLKQEAINWNQPWETYF